MFREIFESKKLSAYDVIDDVKAFGYKEGEFKTAYREFSKGPITVTVKKVKNNSNLKALLGSWEGSNNTYMFDEKQHKTVQSFLEMLDKKDPKRKPKIKDK